MASPTNLITLRTSNGVDVSVPESVLAYSQTIKNMIEDECTSGIIPLPNVDSKSLEKVVEYCTKHTDESVSAEELEAFDTKFLDQLSRNDVYDLLLAANYMHIESLLNALVEKAASLMRAETPAEIRRIFGIVKDVTKEEELEEMEKKTEKENNTWTCGD